LLALKNYCMLTDARGDIQGLVNHGNWQEVNIVHSHALSTRGGHFHRKTTEAILILKGKAVVDFFPCGLEEEKVQMTLLAGEGVQIPPMTVHTFHYLEDSSHLQLLDSRFDPTQPDLFIP
jgi:dTDP-4-dehydrorhamnose 3,5-epimerase-like enzyme